MGGAGRMMKERLDRLVKPDTVQHAKEVSRISLHLCNKKYNYHTVTNTIVTLYEI